MIKKFLTLLLTFFVLLTPLNVLPQQELLSAVDVARLNQVVLTCRGINESGSFLAGGQGEIYSVNSDGVWIITARHVSLNSSSCDAMFPDRSFHTAYLVKQFNKSDISILFVPRAFWPTHAIIRDLQLDTPLFVFSEVQKVYTRTENGALIGFHFDFDYALHKGIAIDYSPAEILIKLNWPVPPGSVAYTNLYSRPGSSGGGVYNANGELVGLVSCGMFYDPESTFIVDISKAIAEESGE